MQTKDNISKMSLGRSWQARRNGQDREASGKPCVNGGGSLGDTATTLEAVNIIPFGKPGSCRELLLVFSLGRREFDERLRQTHDHCSIDCPGITKGILFVTDYWDNERFWDSRAQTFEKLAAKYGVIFAVGIWSGKSVAVKAIIP